MNQRLSALPRLEELNLVRQGDKPQNETDSDAEAHAGRTRQKFFNMKTMLELLIRLQELGHTANRVTNNPQLTKGEKAVAHIFKTLVRECLPTTVLVHYDKLKKRKPELLGCPEVFAMAVLVSAYESQTSRGRRKLVEHFPTCSPAKEKHRPSLLHDRESQKVLAVPPICDPVQALNRAIIRKR